MMPSLDQMAAGDQSVRLREFGSLARALMLGRGRISDARREAEGASTRVREILKQADPGSLGGESPGGWGGALTDYQLVASSFVESLRHVGVFDAMAPAMREVPLRTRLAVSTVAIVGDAVSEGDAKPVHDLSFENEAIEALKVAAVIGVTSELVRVGGPAAMQLVMNELRAAVAAATDLAFVTALDMAVTSPTPTSGDFLGDLRAMLAAVTSGNNARFYAVITPDDAKVVATSPAMSGGVAFPGFTANGGTIAGVNVLVSDQLAASTALLIDASQLAAAPGSVSLDASSQATVTFAETDKTSLWQRDMRALRCERMFGFSLLRPEAVAAIGETDWSGPSQS